MDSGNSVKRSLAELHIASLLLGTGGVFAKLLPFPAFAIIFFRVLVASLFLIGVILFSNRKHRPQLPLVGFFKTAAIGLLLALHFVTYYQAIQMCGFSLALLALFTYPIFSVLLDPIFEKEKLDRWDLLTGALVFIGIALIMPEFSLKNRYTLGILLAIFSAAVVALRNILSRPYVKRSSGLEVLVIQLVVSTAILAPFSIQYLGKLSLNYWLLVLLAGIPFTAVAHLFYIRALKHLKAGAIGVISGTQPIYGALAGVIILGENLRIRAILGGVIIIGSVIFETLKKARAKTTIIR